MARSSVQLEVEGLNELKRDMMRAADLAPKTFEKGMRKITNKFKRDVKAEAKGKAGFGSAENITSGFKVTPVKAERDVFYSYFQPEGRGNKNHHWHLQEFGYDLVRPNWKSREKMIRYKDAGTRLKFIPGKHVVDKVLPTFSRYMSDEAARLVDMILKEGDF